ncbi:unnamed protein product [Microthlaspi erraticum]|uniref:Uncharacterized protein n=1 Tax=Microthlaspi erraticum TaxID=1685480 RepID=A0A6D2IKM0_9BRAS|nr:unnamed protein product [Microthlaspi erraticum]CAA7051403.1 unnamed protein product [Microthlaspi erraticum]
MKLSESRGEAEKHRRQQHFEHELKNMISSLTYMGGAEKAGPSQYGEEENKEEDGIRVISHQALWIEPRSNFPILIISSSSYN